jgi:Domain of unknown function (DUF4232)
MTVLEDDSAPATTDAKAGFSPPTDQELIIKEARRRRRRRWLVTTAVLVVVGVAALVVALPSGRSPSKPKSSIPRAKRSPPAAVAAVAPCAPSDLSVAIGFVQGTAQHWFIPLTFTNVSLASCSVTGNPTLSFVNQAEQMVGMPIKQVSGGSNRPITLRHGESAGAGLWEPDTKDLSRAGQPCSPTSWAAVRISSPAAAVVTPSQGAVSQATTTCATGEGAWVGPLTMPGP